MSTPSAFTYESPRTNLKYEALSIRKLPEAGLKVHLQVFKDKRKIFSDFPNVTIHKCRIEFANRLVKIALVNKEDVEKDLLDLEATAWTHDFREISLSEPTAPLLAVSHKDQLIAVDLLNKPNLIEEIYKDIQAVGVIGERENALILYLAATSRILGNPLSVIVKGSSSSGKSQLVERIVSLMPPTEVLQYSSISPKSLGYMKKDFLTHKLLVIYERPGAEASDYQIRLLQSEQCLKIVTTVKSPKTGEFEAQEKEVKGPFAYFETTTEASIHPENETRCFSLYVDESVEQTKRIHSAQKALYLLPDTELKASKQEVRIKHHALQLNLQPFEVLIPYAEFIYFPEDKTRSRRDLPRFLTLIACVTLLYQKQRETCLHMGTSYLIATFQDYRIAYELSRQLFDGCLEIPPKSREILRFSKSKGKEFTINKLVIGMKWKKSDVRKFLRPLIEQGMVVIKTGSQGTEYIYELINEGDPVENFGLIAPERLECLYEHSKAKIEERINQFKNLLQV